MNITVVGTGYVGLVAGVCFADAGHNVLCVDRDADKIASLKKQQIPIYEPGLEDLMLQAWPRLQFTTDLALGVKSSEVIFIAVGTPEKADGSADLGPTMEVLKAIGMQADAPKYIVLKSTVPVGTAHKAQELCRSLSPHHLEIVNNPEFLKEGAAINDFLKPDRVVIGCQSEKAQKVMHEIYEPFVKNGNPILFMDNVSAEMTKYAANAFLSVKISFINELALLADKVGADINDVRRGFTSDNRINPAFFYPGVGYGGSCFPKDVKALVHTGLQAGIPMQIVQAADEVNDRQKVILFEKINTHFAGQLKGRTIAFWGLAFKPRTDDVREAPALHLMSLLHGAGAHIKAYDPAAMKTMQQATSTPFTACSSALEAAEGADALALVTEWNEFRNPDLAALKSKMKTPVVFDGRNVLDPARLTKSGFVYYCIGRQILTAPHRLEEDC